MTGLEFDSAEPGEPQLKGEMILKTTFGISLDHSKWWDVAVLLFQENSAPVTVVVTSVTQGVLTDDFGAK